ncbi:MAG: response regulator [Nitrosomonadales bacterium]|nr:response regulator [Nitrosomonadales bacterium]
MPESDRGQSTIAGAASYKFRLIRYTLMAIIMVLCIFIPLNLFAFKLYTVAAIDTAALVLTLAVLLDCLYARNLKRSAVLAVTLITLVAVAVFIVMKGQFSTGTWLLFPPLYYFFLFGKRPGFRLTALYAAALGAFVYFHARDWPALAEHDGATISTLFVTGLSFWWLTYFYEEVRESALNEVGDAKTAAEMADRAKSEFLANMSHEIRTPLNSIIGMTYLSLQHTADEKMRDYLGKIEQSGEHLLGVIDDILDYSKIEAGKVQLEQVDFDIRQINAALSHLVSWKAAEKGLSLRFEIAAGMPHWLRGDPLRLKQILLNYLNNAIKFTEQGEIVMRGRVLRQDADSVLLRFEVSDTGIGIPHESQRTLFQPFWQADSSISRKYGGSGLGLVICHRLAGLMAGEVGVESEAGKGSTFWLNVSFEKGDGALSAAADLQRASLLPPDWASFKGVRVLVAEDHSFNTQVVRELLENAGVFVCVANNGEEAIDLLHKEFFDAVLMDLQMPVMDGLEATRRIRNDLGLKYLPIIAMTANASSADRELCMAAGMNDHIGKPFRPEALFSTLGKWLRSAAPTARGAEEAKPFPVQALWRRFLAAAEDDIARIEHALHRGDIAEVGRLGHYAKSPAGLMGATEYYALCEQLELLGGEGHQAQAAAIVSELRGCLQRFDRQAFSGESGTA